MTDITLGQYFPGNSVLHKIDPRMKIILITFYIVILFLAKSMISYGILICFTLLLIYLSKISFKMYTRGLKPLLFIILFTGILNIFYSSGSTVLAQVWFFRITLEGIITAIKMISRIIMLVMSTSVLTYTTSPVLLSGGLERVLSPLKKIKVPIHEFSMMMTIALRFIPTLTDETNKIMSAQKARGADFETGSLIKRIKAVIPIVIPLFVSSFRRADELATAMQCRCYAGDTKGRTRYVKYILCMRDWGAFTILAVLLVCVIFFNKFKFGGFI